MKYTAKYLLSGIEEEMVIEADTRMSALTRYYHDMQGKEDVELLALDADEADRTELVNEIMKKGNGLDGRTYFYDAVLTDGEYVTLVYTSNSRKGTFPHWCDMTEASQKHGMKVVRNKCTVEDMTLFAHILNEKNAEDQCFGDRRVVDIRF